MAEPSSNIPRIIGLEFSNEGYGADLIWDDGFRASVDLKNLVEGRHFEALRDSSRFRAGRIAEDGYVVSLGGDLEWPTTAFRELAKQGHAA